MHAEMPSTIGCSFPFKKRIFDVIICIAFSFLWMPVFILAMILMKVVEGGPIFYVSNRRVCGNKTIRLWKFRTMILNAAELIENDRSGMTNSELFLNVNPDSNLYTKLGRFYERIQLTELPQIFHVLRGQMSIIGARPLPESVINALKEVYPETEMRFLVAAGLTGPVQLVGRDYIGDAQRLRLEIAYCEVCQSNYSVMLDLHILFRTVLMVLQICGPQTIAQTYDLIQKYSGNAMPVYSESPVVNEERV